MLKHAADGCARNRFGDGKTLSGREPDTLATDRDGQVAPHDDRAGAM
ncbi:MAG: hypothetical protein KBA31_00150 [Alphaproteobacteria bacterium]|nr:hypothetical protein [Alphaproteobacteria bacterium]